MFKLMMASARASYLAIAVAFLGLAAAQDGPDSVLSATKRFRKSVVASGLAGPWELTWGPDNMLWVTERTGRRVTRIDPVTGKQKVAITMAQITGLFSSSPNG